MASISLLFLFISFQLLLSISLAIVPASDTFTYVNEGVFGDYVVEYDATYRFLPPSRNPFQLCFYNTTPNSFTLALRMGTVRSEALMRWVWEANRGNPVRENATFTFSADGNLVLADADGRIAWKTDTVGKGVVGFEVLTNGNMVLHDGKGNFIWQSFDSPTDTLLVGGHLRAGGTSRLVSRSSTSSNVDGAYSLVLEPKGLALYYKSPNSVRPLVYWTLTVSDKGSLANLTFSSELADADGSLYEFRFQYFMTNPSSNSYINIVLSRYNNTLGIDGNLRIFTYNPNLQVYSWDVTYRFLDRRSRYGECQLPERCGKFGLCEDSQCVACPTPNGLSGWSQDCESKKVTSCKSGEFGYYKLDGVDHFTIKYTRGDGPTKQSECEAKCSKDCKCMGYFYHTDRSRCWIAYDLKTLTRVGNSTNLAFIKTPKK
ncbi:hypothetical protein OSB04_007983 [Centaurea solstitialis]|uniref:Bulb-type lectin domain-containing protein n=1 Tax=Centaurea solstitialis TaxID=347529 RepID=A0AA38U5E4_9ASTR|nr:hypothetical protein OSB04_007983 [Centaurea solstitialis]